jgi:hypothetical protein
MISDDDRTTPFGLFNYARSYWQSAVHLHHATVKVTHPDAPITLLLAHAVELYIKAFLRLKGLGVKDLKTSFGHDFRSLVEEAQARGLQFDDGDKDLAAILTEQESIRRSRYIETGFYTRPSLRALSATCRSLDESVAAALTEAGHRVRREVLHHIESD